MADIRTLRFRARELGISNFRGMNEKELRSAIEEAQNGSQRKTRVVKKAIVKKAPVKRTTRKPGRPKGSTTKPAPAPRRGRPPKAKVAPAPKRAKRQPAAPRAQTTRRNTQRAQEPTGRHLLNGVDYSIKSDDWNPRADSITGIIFGLLRKFKGNRDKVYDNLLPDVNELFGAKKRTGAKWAKGERERMLAYRIARTAWDFAVRTGQHEIAEDRQEYGTGGTGQGIFKRKPAQKAPARKAATRKAPAKAKAPVKAAKAAPARRGRPPKAAAAKPAQARTGARRGRPPKRQTGRGR